MVPRHGGRLVQEIVCHERLAVETRALRPALAQSNQFQHSLLTRTGVPDTRLGLFESEGVATITPCASHSFVIKHTLT